MAPAPKKSKPSTGPRRAAIYARVSTKDQNASMQLQALREFAGHRGLDVVAEFVDQGVSGTRDSRPKLNMLMDSARKRLIDAVIVYRFDRFARSVKHLVTALHEFDGLGVEFVSYSENFQTSTPIGKAMFAIVAALGQLERDITVERSIEGQRRARERGVKIGRPRAEVDVEELRRLRTDGMSLREIAAKTGVSKNTVARLCPTTP